MKKSRLLGAVCAAAFGFVSSLPHAALVGVLPVTPGETDWQAVYDTDRDITWIANANLAASSTFGIQTGVNLGAHPDYTTGGVSGVPETYDGYVNADGTMNWAGALFWLDAMNAASYLGFSDWRLPFTPQPDPSCSRQSGQLPIGFGYNCTGSDMGHLYNEEGVTAATPSLFSNVQPYYYWSNHDAPGGFIVSYATTAFGFNYGDQGTNIKSPDIFYTWAVRSGDVAVVPIPTTVWLFGSGLLGLIGVARKNPLEQQQEEQP